MAVFFTGIKKQFYVLLIILAAVYCGVIICTGFKSGNTNLQGMAYNDSLFAGSATCKSCHKNIYNTHIGTAHYLTSRPAEKKYIKGSFEPGKNSFTYNRFMQVILEKKKNGFFQTSYINNTGVQSEPFDIVVGSARKGQTYLYWKENRLFQLPLSYYTPLNSWCNSPGYSLTWIKYDRFIPSRCMECHSTYAKVEKEDSTETQYNRSSIIYGVDCEKCHGPAAKHVSFHTENPAITVAKFIITINKLSQKQQLDACALCHSGKREKLKPTFSFKTGDNLDEFSLPAYDSGNAAKLDVHGNQTGLLLASKCFKSSLQMNCSNCHNVHKDEANSPKIFSQRCLTCHSTATQVTCKFVSTKKIVLSNNCIDCHMPLLPSNKIFLQLDDPQKSTADFVRTHRIAVYPEKIKEFINKK